jgi:YidC/Oxa1 family membrane protein insertase
MTNEKRFVLFVTLVFFWMIATSYLFPPRRVPPAPPKADEKTKLADLDEKKLAKIDAGDAAAKGDAEKAKPASAVAAKAAVAPAKPDVEWVKPSELVLGSLTDKSAGDFLLEVRFDQKGAGIDSAFSSRYDAENEGGGLKGPADKRPLQLIGDKNWPPSLALTLSQRGAPDAAPPAVEAEGDDTEVALRRAAAEAEDTLDGIVWEVVRDPAGKVVHQVTATDPATKSTTKAQAIVFRTTAKSGVVVTKTFRLLPNTNGVEVELKFESPDRERTVAYNLTGPHGIPIEGEWYTGTFRDVFFGQLDGQKIKVDSHSASEIADATDNSLDNTALPIVFAGVENQYFATLLAPYPKPDSPEARWDSKTSPQLLHKDEKAKQKSDVGVRISSKPFKIGPDAPLVHNYRVYAGPKTLDTLAPYNAEILATYRKNWIPLAPEIARFFITPILKFTYSLTERVARLFGGQTGNYGIAIILLTVIVRGLMFPIGRKQALAAQKMQNLQPHLKALQEKYKEDKERLTKETFALYKKHGVNPVAGCLPALVQLPIFMGLWQAINTSFPLRHATFLWINDLAAPDMLFRFPGGTEVPLLGRWFNLLPFLFVGLMLVQTKLFSPPATTPEAEMQQKTMKYMMIFMAVMFYKVPSGLAIYFITSSLWSIGERVLLPKITHSQPVTDGASDDVGEEKGSRNGFLNGFGMLGGNKGNGVDGNGTKVKSPGRFAQFMEKVLDEARKDPTYRKIVDERDGKSGDGRERDRDRPRPRPRKR